MSVLKVGRLAAAAFAAFLAACATPAAAPPPPQPASPVVAPKPDYAVWPHDVSDLKPEPDVRYGVLENGMRYALKRNTQPAGLVAIRLRIASGALQETDEQRGLAHFLEHMAFNGSKNVPEGEMIKILERKGLAFGPDTNAYTSFGETVYMLDLPRGDAETLATGLMLMRETADRLTIAEDAVQREKGIILSEERARDTPEYRTTQRRFTFWLKGQRLPTRFPIGTIETIKAADAAKLQDYYRRYYRPERALLVVTGDIDVDALEAKIKGQWSDWSQPGPAGADPDLGTVAPRTREAAVHVEPSGPTSVAVNYLSPPDRSADTRALRIRETRRGLAMDIVNRRLQRIARAADAPFIAAGVFRSDLEKSATIATLSVSTSPAGWEKGLAAGEQALRQALVHGLQQAELDREISEMRAGLVAAAAGAETRDTRALASGIAQAFDERAVFTHPSVDLEVFDAAAKGFTAAEASALLRESFAGQGPLLFLATSKPVSADAVAAAYDASVAKPVEKPAEEKAIAFPYVSFGAPGVVATRTRDAALDADFITFANGVKLNLKKTAFDKDSVGVLVRFAGGQLALPTTPGIAYLAPFAFTEGALGKLDKEGLDRATVGKVVGVGFGLDEDAFTLSGGTRTEDLALQLQLLAAYATDPGWRPQGLARLQAAAENQFASLAASPVRVLGRDAPAIVRSGDKRFAFPSLEQARAVTMADLKAVIAPALASAPIEITIVGDIDPAATIDAVARTFGALPKRPSAWSPPAGAAKVTFPPATTTPITLRHLGRPDQAVGYVAYKARDFDSDPRKARAQRLLRQLVSLRLTEEFRERLGASYSPTANDFASEAFPGFGFLSATAETPPKDTAEFFRIVEEIAAELRAGKFDDDLLARAREPLVDQAQTAERTNGFWLSALSDAQTDPVTLPALKSRIGDLRSITKAEIVAAAQDILRPENRVKILVEPQP